MSAVSGMERLPERLLTADTCFSGRGPASPLSPSTRSGYTPYPPSRTSSPPGRMRSSTMESITSSSLYRDLSPTRVSAAHTTAESSVLLPELFKQRNALQALRPGTSGGDTCSSPRDYTEMDSPSTSTPRLLTRLEALLEERLAVVDRLGNGSKGFAATQLRLDAYRQVFDAFLHSFTTYRTLLSHIKEEYDAALDDALASLYDNVHMKAELAGFADSLESSTQAAKRQALADVALISNELQEHLTLHDSAAAETEQRCQATETQIQQCRHSVESLKQQAAELQRHNKSLKHQLVTNSSWKSAQLLTRYQTDS